MARSMVSVKILGKHSKVLKDAPKDLKRLR